jgi:hypothetical protein
VGSCLECHDDRHSRAYLESSHHERWEAELGGRAPDGTGVSCATCHLPRVRRAAAARPGVVVEHDQNASLRPVETMVRPVCLGCHGLGFSLAALADPSLVERSFDGPPASRARTVDMVRDRARRPPPAAEEEPR